MKLSYDGIEFKILAVTDYVREMLFTPDEATYLYDHVGIRCTTWLNPGATGPGQSPVTTELQLVKRLSQPRKVLIVTMDDQLNNNPVPEILIRSPNPGRTVDARVGPQCKVHNVNCDHGNGSLVADLEFHTWIATCNNGANGQGQEQPNVPPSPILSNRWTYQVTYEKVNYAETRIVSGAAIFRMDELIAQLNGNADLVRQYLVPPKSPGYQRLVPEFELSEIGDALRYVTVDRQVGMSMPRANMLQIANISVMESRMYAVNAEHGIMGGLLELFGLPSRIGPTPNGFLDAGGVPTVINTSGRGPLLMTHEQAEKEGLDIKESQRQMYEGK